MDKQVIELLQKILANQVVIYKRIEDVEYKIKGGMRSAPLSFYVDELHKKAEEALNIIKSE